METENCKVCQNEKCRHCNSCHNANCELFIETLDGCWDSLANLTDVYPCGNPENHNNGENSNCTKCAQLKKET